MIYHLQGTLDSVIGQTAIIDCGGVGYLVTVTNRTAGVLHGKEGKTVKIFTYLAVKEDAFELYGFSSEKELEIFKLLISVNGVGAKYAVAILSVMDTDEFANAVSTSDTRAITRAQGVGPKLAQRIILELKDKLGSVAPIETTTSHAPSSLLSDAEDMLVSLGYSQREASDAVRSIDSSGLELEEIFKKAIAKLAK